MGLCVEVGQFGLDGEVDRLRRDKQVLMLELVKLRQQQQNTSSHLQAMEERLQGTELKQQQMMNFLARALQNPSFIQQLVQQKGKRKVLDDAINKKRRRPIDQGPSGESIRNPVKSEPLEVDGFSGFEISELEALALEMQGIGKSRKEQEVELLEQQEEQRHEEENEIDEEFWEELLNEDTEGGEDEDVNALANRLDYLGSSPR